VLTGVGDNVQAALFFLQKPKISAFDEGRRSLQYEKKSIWAEHLRQLFQPVCHVSWDQPTR
jgi:hypothetical protein